MFTLPVLRTILNDVTIFVSVVKHFNFFNILILVFQLIHLFIISVRERERIRAHKWKGRGEERQTESEAGSRL